MNIEFTVDKRTEMLGILLLISDYAKLFPEEVKEGCNKEYRDKIFNSFLKFKDEKAVLLFNRIINELNFSYDAQPCLFLQLNEDFTYDELEEYPFHTRLKKSSLVLEFLQELPNFAKKIEFEEYYQSNLKFYEQIIESSRTLLDANSVEDFMFKFYKLDFSDKKYVINFLPFITNSCFGFELSRTNSVYCNPGIFYRAKVLEFFEKGDENLLIHEFSHPIVNPLTDKYSNIPYENFEDCAEKLLKQGYNIADVIVNEYIIRAIELVYLKHELKDEHCVKERIEIEKNRGFKDICAFVDILSDYYNNLDKYENFEEFFPILVERINCYYGNSHNV